MSQRADSGASPKPSILFRMANVAVALGLALACPLALGYGAVSWLASLPGRSPGWYDLPGYYIVGLGLFTGIVLGGFGAVSLIRQLGFPRRGPGYFRGHQGRPGQVGGSRPQVPSGKTDE